MAAYCLRYSGPGQSWQILPILRSEFNLGRADGNDLVLPSALVSRQHARLYIQGDQLWLLDLNSSNGTFSNGQCIPPNQWIKLAPGQVIQIGEFMLCVDPVQDQPAVPPPYPPGRRSGCHLNLRLQSPFHPQPGVIHRLNRRPGRPPGESSAPFQPAAPPTLDHCGCGSAGSGRGFRRGATGR